MRRAPWRWRLEYVLGWLVLQSLGRLPRRWALRLGSAIGGLAHALLRSRRRVALANLALAMPELTPWQRSRIARDSFTRLGRLIAEFALLPRLTPAAIREVARPVGHEHYLAARARGHGVIFLTAHYGAWELLPYAQALLGHPLKFVVRPLDNPWLDRLIGSYRTRCGNGVIERREAARGVVRALKDGQAVGILFDQNTSDGVVVPFFGLPTRTTPVIATLALRTDAPVVPVFLAGDPTGETHTMIFEPPVELVRTGQLKRDIEANTERFNRILEQQIRRRPDHWLWLHRRWKDSPVLMASVPPAAAERSEPADRPPPGSIAGARLRPRVRS